MRGPGQWRGRWHILPQGPHERRVDFILSAAARRNAACGKQIIAVMAYERTTFVQSIRNSLLRITPPWFIMAHAVNG